MAVLLLACGSLARGQEVKPACSELAIAPEALPELGSGALDVALRTQGGMAPYVFSSADLPAGVVLTRDGRLTGVPLAMGRHILTVDVRDQRGCRGTRRYALLRHPRTHYLVAPGPASENPAAVRTTVPEGPSAGAVVVVHGSGWGANLAAGNVAGDARDEVFAAPGPGPTLPGLVRGFDGSGRVLPALGFFASGTRSHGARIAVGDVNGDGLGEIVTGPGIGSPFSPDVRGFTVRGGKLVAIPGLSFQAHPSFSMGVSLAAGDLGGEGPGMEEILVGAGPGLPSATPVRVFGLTGDRAHPVRGIAFAPFPEKGVGVMVAAGDVDADGLSELVVTPGPGPGDGNARFRGFGVGQEGARALPGFDLAAYPTRYGGSVGAGDVLDRGRASLLASPGPDPSAPAAVTTYDYRPPRLAMSAAPVLAFERLRRGANVTAASLGDVVPRPSTPGRRRSNVHLEADGAAPGLRAPGDSFVVVASGGTLAGTGVVAIQVGPMTHPGGTISPGSGAGTAATLTLDADFAAGPAGRLDIELGGFMPGVDHDHLAITKAAALGGAIHVDTIGPFTPVPGDAFVIASYATRTGTFGPVSNDTPFPTLTFAVSYDDTPGSAHATLHVGPTTPGSVPDGAGVPGVPLMLSKNATVPTDVDLTWGGSCRTDATDYTVHEGAIGTWYGHTSIRCSTGGAVAATVTPAGGSTYYLVVPRTPTDEGSYGKSSGGVERPVSAVPCASQTLGACP